MGKLKEIKFKRQGRHLEGRQNNIHFWIREDRELAKTCAPAFSVSAHDLKTSKPVINTGHHYHFHLDEAKALCQRIAAGQAEDELEAIQARIDAAEWAAEEAAIKAATERAKAFRDKLEAAGISYMTLLDLIERQQDIGDMAHNILVGWETGRT